MPNMIDADAELPLESKPDVGEHRDKSEAGCEQAVAKQLTADPGADDLSPPDLHAGQCFGHAGRDHLLRILEVRPVLEAKRDVLGRAELLHSEVAKAESAKASRIVST